MSIKPILIKRNVNKYRRWPIHLYKCNCGAQFESLASKVNNGNTKSCGCIKRAMLEKRNKSKAHKAKITTHGQSRPGRRSGTYNTWGSMIQRCANPNNTSYEYYGGRGIKVCDRWLNSFEDFLTDMGERPKGMSIDRIDNNGNYELNNCRWATSKQQIDNRRNTKK